MRKENAKIEWLPFGDLFEKISTAVEVDPNGLYREIGVRCHAKGVFHKEPILGKVLGEKRVFQVVPGALVFNIVFAWEQGVAMLGKSEEGMIASHRFPMFRSMTGRVSEDFASLFFSTPRGKMLLEIASPGGAGRNRTLSQDELNKVKIPAPPVEYQKKFVAAYRAVEAYVDRLELLIAEKRKFKAGVMGELLGGHPIKDESKMVRLDEVAVVGFSGVDKKSEGGETPVRLCNYVDVLRNHEITDAIDFMPATATEHEIRRFALQQGDIILTKDSETREDIAHLARVACPLEGVVCGYHLAHIRPLPDKIDPLYLSYWLESHAARKHFVQWAMGAGVRYGLPLGAMEEAPVWLPPRKHQTRIATALQLIDLEISRLEFLAAKTGLYKRGLMQNLLTSGGPHV